MNAMSVAKTLMYPRNAPTRRKPVAIHAQQTQDHLLTARRSQRVSADQGTPGQMAERVMRVQTESSNQR